MKMTLPLLLCLLLGCKEIDQLTRNEKPPAPTCLIYDVAQTSSIPDREISVVGLRGMTRYRIVLENKILWDECTRSSELGTNSIAFIPEANTSNGSHTVFRGSYYELFQLAEVKTNIFELDSYCQPITPALIDNLIPLKITSGSYTDGCGKEYKYESRDLTIEI